MRQDSGGSVSQMKDEERTAAAVRELVATWFDDQVAPEVRGSGDRSIGLIVYGLVSQVHHLGRCCLSLHDAGLGTTNALLVRQALECSLTASWLELGGAAAMSAMGHEFYRQEGTLARELRESGVVGDDVVDAKADAEPIGVPGAASRNFQTLCNELEGGAGLYLLYRALSGLSHAGGKVVDLYLDGPDEALATRRNPAWPMESLFWSTLLEALVLAGAAWQRVGRGGASLARLEALAEEFEVRPVHEYTEAGSRAQEVRVQSLEERRSSRGR